MVVIFIQQDNVVRTSNKTNIHMQLYAQVMSRGDNCVLYRKKQILEPKSYVNGFSKNIFYQAKGKYQGNKHLL